MMRIESINPDMTFETAVIFAKTSTRAALVDTRKHQFQPQPVG